MRQPFEDSLKEVAAEMGISVYQQFTLTEASLFLRCPSSDLEQLINKNEIPYIQLSQNEVHFFGYQLLQHLLNNVIQPTTKSLAKPKTENSDRILRATEVQQLVGLSRTTLWRMERKGTFPNRLPLGTGSIGWLKSDIEFWIQNRK